MRVQSLMAQGRDRLRAAGIAGADLDARWLMAAALGLAPDRVILHLQDLVTEEGAFFFEDAIARRLAREPVSHILGGRWFYGRWFHVTSDVLDPRPETETLVAAALSQPFAQVLDLGTGSGAILLSLLAERPAATGVGTDVSEAALAIADWNARDLGLSDRLVLMPSDWWAAVGGPFDLIVSNPPYIAADEMPDLAPEVHEFEPHIALTDGADGLSAYRAIAAQAPAHLTPGGRLLVEIGWTQAAAVSGLFADAGLDAITVHTDINAKPRVVEARRRTAETAA